MRAENGQSRLVNGNAGFSLVEILATVVILGLLISALVTLTNNALATSLSDADREKAVMIAHDYIARVATKSLTVPAAPLQGQTQFSAAENVNGVAFTVDVTETIDATTKNDDVEVQVSWPSPMDGGNTGSLSVEQIVQP